MLLDLKYNVNKLHIPELLLGSLGYILYLFYKKKKESKIIIVMIPITDNNFS
jgi:hypothetical protein